MSKRRSQYSVEKDETPKLSREQSKKQFRFLLSFLTPHKFKIIAALSFLIVSSGVTVLFPALIGLVIDIKLNPTATTTISSPSPASGFISSLTLPMRSMTSTAIILAVVIALLIQSAGRYIVSVTLVRISETTLATIRTDLFQKIIQLPMAFFSERRVGELASRLTSDLGLIQETFTYTFLELLRQSVVLIGGVILIAGMSLQLTSVILLALPLLVVIGVVFGRYIRTYSTRTQDVLAEAATIVEESLQAITSVKSFVNEDYETKRYSSAIQRGAGIAVKGAKLRSAFVSFIIFALFGGMIAVIWYGGDLVQRGLMTIGQLMSFLMYAMFVGGALGSFAELLGQIQRTLGASVRVQELMKEEPEQLQAGRHSETPFRSLEVEDISFSYPGRKDIAALQHVSLRINSGERIAFVGESGAGKSTMAALIQKFYEPDEGMILYDSLPSTSLSIADIRRNVGVVPQDIVLFGGTIADNIRYGNLEASHEAIGRAAELANATEFIEKFPEKFETVVGERGIKLSGGQRQRIAIARAILKNPPILILDEATSSLDSQTEHLIQEAMERLMKGRTTIIIAHRLSTIRKCDRIYVFSKGKIVESGTHESLLSEPDSFYAKLCALQFGEQQEAASTVS